MEGAVHSHFHPATWQNEGKSTCCWGGVEPNSSKRHKATVRTWLLRWRKESYCWEVQMKRVASNCLKPHKQTRFVCCCGLGKCLGFEQAGVTPALGYDNITCLLGYACGFVKNEKYTQSKSSWVRGRPVYGGHGYTKKQS